MGAALPSNPPTLGAPSRDFSGAAPSGVQLAELARYVDRLATLGCVAAETTDDLRQKIASQRFDLVVAGQFKRGKTSLINALLGAELLPVAVVPLTSIVTAVSYGETSSATIVLRSGESKAIDLAQLQDYVTEQRNPGNHKQVREALVSYPSPWLGAGVRLIDTPGVGSIYEHNSDVTHRFLPKSDAVIFLLSVDQPLSQGECDFLTQIRRNSDKVFFVLNKIDLLTERELAESLAFTRDALAKVLGAPPKLFPLSTRLALEGRLKPSRELLDRSRMPLLLHALEEFLTRDRDTVLIASLARQVSRTVAQGRFDIEFEHHSLRVPLEELERKAKLIQEKKREIFLAQDELALLLVADAKRTLHAPLEEHLNAYKGELMQRLRAGVNQLADEQRMLSLRQLSRLLEEHVTNEVRAGFDAWQTSESAALDKSFDAFCARHATKIDESVDALVRFAADLFAVSSPDRRAEAFHATASHFYYKFWSEPPSLKVLASWVIFALPNSLGKRLVVERARQHALETVEMQAGRLRYDFSQRLDHAVASFRSAMEARVEGAARGIEAAIDKATKLQVEGHAAIAERCEALSSTLRSLDDVAARLAALTAVASRGDTSPAITPSAGRDAMRAASAS